MKPKLTPFHLRVTSLAEGLNKEQRRISRYPRAENEVLRQQLGKKRFRLTDLHRRMLAIKGEALGGKLLGQWASFVTPHTILRWHDRLMAPRVTYTRSPNLPRRGAQTI